MHIPTTNARACSTSHALRYPRSIYLQSLTNWGHPLIGDLPSYYFHLELPLHVTSFGRHVNEIFPQYPEKQLHRLVSQQFQSRSKTVLLRHK